MALPNTIVGISVIAIQNANQVPLPSPGREYIFRDATDLQLYTKTSTGTILPVAGGGGAAAGSGVWAVSASSYGGPLPVYVGFFSQISSNTESDVSFEHNATSNLTLSRFQVKTIDANPSPSPLVITVFKNGVATALTVTIPAAAPAGTFQENTASVSAVPGDTFSVEITGLQAGPNVTFTNMTVIAQ